MSGIVDQRAPAAAEAALVTALRGRDERAFLEVVSANQRALVRVAMAHALDRAGAEAVVREAWVAVVQGLDGFDGRRSLRAWIAALAAERARARAAREGCAPPAVLAGAEAGAGEPTVDPDRFMGPGSIWAGHWRDPPRRFDHELDRADADGLAALARAALDSLPPLQRAVVGLRDVEGWSASDVCHGLGIDSGQERALLHRGRARMRRALELHLDGR